MSDDELLTLDEARRILGVSKPTFYRVARGFSVGAERKPRFKRSDILRIKELRKHIPSANPDDQFFDKLRRDREKRKLEMRKRIEQDEDRQWRRDILQVLREIAGALKQGY